MGPMPSCLSPSGPSSRSSTCASWPPSCAFPCCWTAGTSSIRRQHALRGSCTGAWASSAMISTVYRFRRVLRQYWLLLLGGALFTLGRALLALAQPWPLKVIVDSPLQNKPVKVPAAELLQGRSRGFILDVAVAAYAVIL